MAPWRGACKGSVTCEQKKDKINATHRSSIDETHDRFSARAIKSFAMRNSRTGAIGPFTGTRPLIFVKSRTHRPPQPITRCVRVSRAYCSCVAHTTTSTRTSSTSECTPLLHTQIVLTTANQHSSVAASKPRTRACGSGGHGALSCRVRVLK
jgi:hypothetical protein